MAKTYRTLQQWDHWLAHHYLGRNLIEIEEKFLAQWWAERYGNHALLIGVPKQSGLLKSSMIANHTVLTPLLTKDRYIKLIESGYYNLPIVPGSVDVVLIPHTLELIDNPRLLLTEACRVVRPGGDIIIFGFNPFSLWGLAKSWYNNKNIPWSHHFNPVAKVRNWLELADFSLIKQKEFLFRPPVRETIYHKLNFLEWMGEKCHIPLGGLYVLVAKAKTVPVMPIKLRWKQSLSRGISVSYPGPSMRDIQ